jgi:rare lipoprotein A
MTIIRDIFLKTSLILSLVLWLSFLINAQNIEVGYSQTGQASYYANQFHGKKTASGEKYDMYAMTAAHPNIPFNSIIKVTNTKNGKWVTLRVNDRGPFSKKRIVDVSKAAALMLDMVKDGIAEVKLEVMRVGNDDSTNIENNTPQVEEEKEDVKDEKKEKKDKNKKEKSIDNEDKKTKSNVVPEKSIKPVGTYSVFGVVKKAKGYGAQIATYGEVKKAIDEGKRAIKLGLKDVYIQAGYDKEKPVYRVIFGAKSSEKSAKSLVSEAKKKGFSEAFTRKHF